jgi:hypothetical protein
MSAPDPEGMGLLAAVSAAAAAILAPAFGAWAWIDRRFAKKHSVADEFQTVWNEIATQRAHIGKIFDQMRDNEQKSEERHREILMHLLERKR